MNSIQIISVAELLDGRYFYIPAYQRGYRWTEKQIGDLLRDILTFAYDNTNNNGNYYCLQQVVAKRIDNDSDIKNIVGDSELNNAKQRGVWEVIDGQQRLTTLYIIFQYILNSGVANLNALKQMGKGPYHIYYETRKGSSQFLEQLNNNYNNCALFNNNVDYYRMAKAYEYVDEWINTVGLEIDKRNGGTGWVNDCLSKLFKLFITDKKQIGLSLQFLWYELDGTTNHDKTIEEFRKMNTGKISLTDAELVKGMFLLKKNFGTAAKDIQQAHIALEWEFVENALQKDDFWRFLTPKDIDYDNRIDFLFTILYKKERIKERLQHERTNSKFREENIPSYIKDEVKKADKELSNPRDNAIFRFYYDKFDGKQGQELYDIVKQEWENVMEQFRVLDHWYSKPKLYNYIGLLSKFGEDVADMAIRFEQLPDTSESSAFETYLESRIKHHLSGLKTNPGHTKITNLYGDEERNNIFRALLTFNILILNEENDKVNNSQDEISIKESDSHIYKFPFDIFYNHKWNIEHIDSVTTADILKAGAKREDQQTWIETALDDLDIAEKTRNDIENLIANDNYEKAITELKEIAGEEIIEDEYKHSIGNLTLLDEQTNKSYGNSLFVTKRRIIFDKVKKGTFVPVGTQNVFAKLFDEKGTNRSLWTKDDIENYHKEIFSKLKKFITF